MPRILNLLHHVTIEMPYLAFSEPFFFPSPHAEDVLLAVMVLMDITGYQAATVEMDRKAKRAWLALKVHVVKKEMRE